MMDRQRLQERVGLYSLLRALYSYPLREPVLEAVVSLEIAPASPLAPGLSRMQTRLQGHGFRPAALEVLNTEMTRLLEGPGLTPAPPYASYYLHDGRLMGPAAVAVRRVYLDWQAVPASDVHLPDDHIALELGFLAYLAARAAGGSAETEKVLQASHDFIQQHLLPWLPRFCAALGGASADPFFTGLADFTRAAVEADLEWLMTVLAENTTEAAGIASLQRDGGRAK